MKVVLFDTETTGLPKTREPATKGPHNWPHLVSIAWIVLENDKVIRERYFVIRPENWEIPSDSTAIHGITQQYALNRGHGLRDVLQEFTSERSDILVAHNMKFDYNVLCNAFLWDLNMPIPQFNRLMCTMEIGTELCKIPSPYNSSKYRYPKLVELYELITKKKPDNQSTHNSLYDTTLLKEIVLNSNYLRSFIGLPVENITTINVRSKNNSNTLSIDLTGS
jgi:DNA polymerase III epsilon subunit-like protein